MKVFSILSAIVATALVGTVVAAPVAVGEAVAKRTDLEDRGLATMFYGCDLEYEVDDADPDVAKKLKERCIPAKK